VVAEHRAISGVLDLAPPPQLRKCIARRPPELRAYRSRDHKVCAVDPNFGEYLAPAGSLPDDIRFHPNGPKHGPFNHPDFLRRRPAPIVVPSISKAARGACPACDVITSHAEPEKGVEVSVGRTKKLQRPPERPGFPGRRQPDGPSPWPGSDGRTRLAGADRSARLLTKTAPTLAAPDVLGRQYDVGPKRDQSL